MIKSIKSLTKPGVLMVLLTLAWLLVACGGDPGNDETASNTTETLSTLNYAGPVKNSAAFIGFALKGDQVTAYICDSQNIAAWLDGKWNGENLNLTSTDGTTLQAKKDAKAISGTVQLSDGQPLNFSVPPVGDRAGIFLNEEIQDDQLLETGWIILADGQERGLTIVTNPYYKGKHLKLPNRPGIIIPAPCARCIRGGTGAEGNPLSKPALPTATPKPPKEIAQGEGGPGRRVVDTPTPASGKQIADEGNGNGRRVLATATPDKAVVELAGNGSGDGVKRRVVDDPTPTPAPCARCIPGGAAGFPPLQVGPTPTPAPKSVK